MYLMWSYMNEAYLLVFSGTQHIDLDGQWFFRTVGEAQAALARKGLRLDGKFGPNYRIAVDETKAAA